MTVSRPRSGRVWILAVAAALLVFPARGAEASSLLRVFLPASGRTYFEPDQSASVDIDEPVDPVTLVVKLDGMDVTAQFAVANRRAKATLMGLAAGPHTLEARATGLVFDPLLFRYVTQDFSASSSFMIATPVSAADFIALGIDSLVRRDLLAARDAFTQARTLQRSNQQAALLLALTRIAILLDPTLPGSNPALLDSVGEFLDALGLPPEGRDIFDFTAMVPMDPQGHVVLPPTSPRGPEAQRFASQDVLPQVIAAINDLRIIGARFNYLFPADRLGEGFAPVEIDFADIQMLRGALFLAEAGILAGRSYDLDFGAPDVLVQKGTDGTLDVQQDVILANPDFLKLVSTSDLKTIKNSITGGINSILVGLASMDAETDAQNNDSMVIPPDQKIEEGKAKQFLVVLRGSLSRKTLVPPVHLGPIRNDSSELLFLGPLFDHDGLDLRPLLPQFTHRPGGTIAVLSRTFPDPTFGGVLPAFTPLSVLRLGDTLPPDINVQTTGFPTDPNMFHLRGTIVEEDLAAGLNLDSWRVTLTLYESGDAFNPIFGFPIPPPPPLTFDVTDRFPLSRNPDGTVAIDSFVRFTDPTAPRATLTFAARDLNGNLQTEVVSLDLLSAIFLDPAAAHAVSPIHPGDGLAGHFVKTGTVSHCCTAPSPDQLESLASLQAGDPGVVAVVERPITTELELFTSDGDLPNTWPGVARLSGYIRVTDPGIFDFQVDPCCGASMRLKVGGRKILDSPSDVHLGDRAVYFSVPGFYGFEVLFGSDYISPGFQIKMVPGEGGSVHFNGPNVPAAILYQTLDADGDGITDSVELGLGLDPNDPSDLGRDDDGDGLTGLEEFHLGTRADRSDTDGDGLGDGEEIVAGVDGVITDPLDPDADGDGLLDGEETLSGNDGFVTDPFSADTDGDATRDGTDLIPVPASADISVTSPVVRPQGARVSVQLRLADGTPIAKAGIPITIAAYRFNLPASTAHFSGAPVEGTLTSGGGTNVVRMLSSAAGRYVIDLFNDTALEITVAIFDEQSVGIDGQLLFSNFESSDGGFVQTEGTAWEFGTPTSGPGAASSGTHVWATRLAGNYPLGERAVLRSPSIAVHPLASSLRVCFRQARDFGESVFGDVAVDMPFDPQRILFRYTYQSPAGRYEYTCHTTINDPDTTTRLYFIFSSVGATESRPGWYLDDVRLTTPRFSATSAVFQ